MKKIGHSDIIGQRGISHIEGVVLSMGYMFYTTGGVEAGIDGYIELRDAQTGIVGNILIQIQGKATEQDRLPGETEEGFEFPCSEDDIAYWSQGTAPVLLLVVHLKSGKAYWRSIKDWLADKDRVNSRKVTFDKKRDLFTADAKAAITNVALAARPGATAPSVRLKEKLLPNLVAVGFAPKLYWAPTSHSTDKSFGAAIRELDPKIGSEWIVRGKSVLAFHDLDQWPWNQVCEAEAMEEFDVDEWSDSDDEDRLRDFVSLLNRALGEFVRPDLYHHRTSGVFFFRKLRDRKELKYAYRSLRSTTSRRVVGAYGKKTNDPRTPSYFRHSGFLHRFLKLGGKWFVEMTPTYHFTFNGRDDDKFAGERLKKIKEMENNAAVMGQFVMWRDFLSTHRSVDDLVSKRYPFLSFSAIDPLQLEVGVPDDVWIAQEEDPSSAQFKLDLIGEIADQVA
jgi:hypothetical protein